MLQTYLELKRYSLSILISRPNRVYESDINVQILLTQLKDLGHTPIESNCDLLLWHSVILP